MVPATDSSTTDSISSGSSGTDVTEDFGANDWLIEEMYEQYTADPDSVDPSWVKYFTSHDQPAQDQPAPAGTARSNGQTNGSKTPAASASTAAPKPAAQPAAAKPAAAKPTVAPGEQTPPPQSPNQPVAKGAAPAAPKPAAAKPNAEAGNGSARRPSTVEQGITTKDDRPVTPGKGGGLPADPPNPSHRPNLAVEEPVKNTLRGAPARTAKNMDISLTVPTATSVRSLPVKLMIDQRVVINNHLRRARGGKVSYTHLIGYAMVQALKSVPAMNNGYESIDGKPTMVVPNHVNLGLAIDLPAKDGSRQLLVPSIKSCESLDFAQFWAAYEEVVKKARGGSLTVADFAGTTITLTNPGTIGTNHS
ncbi:MAG: 2-oxo acid dehydrogenase subunit E2, partial [Propionibacteriaceae bacterium]